MKDIIEVDYEQLDEIEGRFLKLANDADALRDKLKSRMEKLLEYGFKGDAALAFKDEMNDTLLPTIDRLAEGFSQSQKTTKIVREVMRDAEVSASKAFDLFASPMLRGGFAGGGGGGGGGGAWGEGIVDIDRFPDFPNTMFPTQTEILRKYLGGELTSEQAHDMMQYASKDPVWRNMVKVEGDLFEKELWNIDESISRTPVNIGPISGQLDFINIDTDAKIKGTIGDGQLNVGAEGEFGVYLGRFRAQTPEVAGFQASLDARAGARVEGKAGIEINPREGTAQFVARGEAFAGAEVEVHGGFENEYFGVDVYGRGAIGVGAKGEFDVGLENGRFHLNVGGTVADGIGGGGGVNISIDIPKTAELIVNESREGAETLIHNVGNALDSIF